MPAPNNTRTHWFLGTNMHGQQMRLCNGHVTGSFVTKNVSGNETQVTCTACKSTIADPIKMAKRITAHVEYRKVWG